MKVFLQKHKWLLFIEMIGILACLAACFIPEKEVFSVTADEISRTIQSRESNDYHSERIELLPGVYKLKVRLKDHEDSLYMTVQADESTFQALRCNGATVYPHQREIELEVYAAGKVKAAYLSSSNVAGNGQPVEVVRLYRTNIGWRLFLFILLLSETGLNILLWLRDGVKSKRISREQEIVFWGLAVSVLLAYIPYATDYFSIKGDGAFHLLRIEGLARTLLRGDQFPVRIQEYWLFGHGYAISSFYGDLFIMFPALLRIIGFSLMTADKLFVMAVLIATAVIAYYSFYGCTKERYSALIGSVLYQLAPYHVYNIYNRNATG